MVKRTGYNKKVFFTLSENSFEHNLLRFNRIIAGNHVFITAPKSKNNSEHVLSDIVVL